MFPIFEKHYHPTATIHNASPAVQPQLLFDLEDAIAFLGANGGTTFNHGVYRVHEVQALDKWNNLIGSAFPQFAKRIRCFGYDWLGRQFALDERRKKQEEPLVLMFEPGTGFALEIPANFKEFHENVLVNQADAALAVNAFKQWHSNQSSDLSFSQCVGYTVPLFLGGEDGPSNFEVCDMEVYWAISGQLLMRARKLPDGSKIGKVSIS